MKGFLIIGYDNSKSELINTQEVENEILRRWSGGFIKKKFDNNVVQNIVGYQINREERSLKYGINNNENSSIFIAGDFYGYLKDYNTSLLSYKESVEFIQKSSFFEKHIEFEGNSCICQITNANIILQNDLEGYRKLYYYFENGLFCISTSMPLIIKSLKKRWKIRKNAIISYITSRESKWPLTFLEDVNVLPPLSRLVVTKNGMEISSKSYSDFYDLQYISKSDLKELLYDYFELIIKRKTSKNTAVTLSGGYDSNCLTKLYSDVYGKDFTAISLGYDAKFERGTNINNETIYSERIARKLGIPFKKYILNKEMFYNEIDAFIDSIDQPGHDPSSNFIMNKYLKLDGFDLVVNGMGGDANFSDKKYKNFVLSLNKFRSKTERSGIDILARSVKYKGLFKFFKPYGHLEQTADVHALFERSQIFKSHAWEFINKNIKKEVDEERLLRKHYFDNLYSKAKTNQEIFYSRALLCSPDEYHALSMAEINNIQILMPFVNTKISLMVMNGSKYNKVTNRKFEMDVFKGINEDLLAKSKSGLSIPYSEWMSEYSNKVFEYYNDLRIFSNEDIDLISFRNQYNNDISIRNSNFANIVLWKLLVVAKYIQKYNLIFE